jgi:hypothetical protein
VFKRETEIDIGVSRVVIVIDNVLVNMKEMLLLKVKVTLYMDGDGDGVNEQGTPMYMV